MAKTVVNGSRTKENEEKQLPRKGFTSFRKRYKKEGRKHKKLTNSKRKIEETK